MSVITFCSFQGWDLTLPSVADLITGTTQGCSAGQPVPLICSPLNEFDTSKMSSWKISLNFLANKIKKYPPIHIFWAQD